VSVLPSAKLLSDERLALLAGGGSDPAFAMLYRRYDGALHGYCMSIVRDADEARDALQNAWIKVLVALRRGGRSAPVRPWLFRIVHNEAISVLRRRSSHEPLLDGHRSGSARGADEEAAGREQLAEVVADIGVLPESQRAALVMREWADLGYGEIALALATSEGNARQLVYQARSGLTEWRDARVVPCDAIRQEVAQADGRRLRKRGVRAHLSTCAACREFSVEIRERRRAAAAAVLPWSPLPGAGVLDGILAAAGGSAGAAGGSGLLIGLAKGAAVAALVTGGAGAADLASKDGASGLRDWGRQRGDAVSKAPEAQMPLVVANASTSDTATVRPAVLRDSGPMPAGRTPPARDRAPGDAGADSPPVRDRKARAGDGQRPARRDEPGDRPPAESGRPPGDDRPQEASGSRDPGTRTHQASAPAPGGTAGGAPQAPPPTHTNVLLSSSPTHTDGWSHVGLSPRIEEQR
jgi:RNA polymerase sigma factor (sigma-70 family)